MTDLHPDPKAMRSDDLRRHMRDAHHMDPDYLRNLPDSVLDLDHQWSHEDGLDIEPHEHAEEAP